MASALSRPRPRQQWSAKSHLVRCNINGWSIYEDDPLKIGFNIQIVLDTLKTLEEEELILQFNDNTTPVLIESTVQNITTKNIIVPIIT